MMIIATLALVAVGCSKSDDDDIGGNGGGNGNGNGGEGDIVELVFTTKSQRFVDVPSADIADRSTFHLFSMSVKYISL